RPLGGLTTMAQVGRRSGESGATPKPATDIEPGQAALARLYDLDLVDDPGDLELYLALASRSGGPIVELAVGTGRLAIPLAVAGHEVIGVDDDPAMLARAMDGPRAARA